MFNTPCSRRPYSIWHMSISDQSPIGTYHSIISIFLTQQAGDDCFVERHRHIFIRLVHGDAIIRHDGCCLRGECSLEGNEVVIEMITRIDLSLLKFKVWIQPLVLWTSTREMFG